MHLDSAKELLLSHTSKDSPDNSLALVEELFDTHGLCLINELLHFLVLQLEPYDQCLSSTKGNGLALLRFLNEVLKRLNRNENQSQYAGALFLLSRIFSISEKSSINLKADQKASRLHAIKLVNHRVFKEYLQKFEADHECLDSFALKLKHSMPCSNDNNLLVSLCMSMLAKNQLLHTHPNVHSMFSASSDAKKIFILTRNEFRWIKWKSNFCKQFERPRKTLASSVKCCEPADFSIGSSSELDSYHAPKTTRLMHQPLLMVQCMAGACPGNG